MSENNVIGTGRCWFGKTRREGCDNYQDGKCAGLVHPTWPPQLGDCPMEPCDKRMIGEADPVFPNKPSAMENAYKTVFHLAKVISGGGADRFQRLHVASAMLSACRAYIDAHASDLCSPNTGKPTDGRYREDGYAEYDRHYCPYRDDHKCRHSHHVRHGSVVCAYCADSPSSAWRPEGIPLSEMPEEARRICENFDRKAAEAANGVFVAKDKVNNRENENEATDTGDRDIPGR